MSNVILVPISAGELFDKISILEIKSERLFNEEKLANVNHEMRLLKDVSKSLTFPDREKLIAILPKLKEVNERIWEAEDNIRDFEKKHIFDENFLSVARSIYRLNDTRAAVKRDLNLLCSSIVVEEKSYSKY